MVPATWPSAGVRATWPSAGAACTATTFFVKEEYPFIAVSTEHNFESCSVSSHQVAYVCGVVAASRKFVLQSVFTPPDERRQGIATSLILRLVAYCREQHGVTVIELDDMSDHYRQNDNIYLKLGFKYLEETGPEMRAETSTILKYREDRHSVRGVREKKTTTMAACSTKMTKTT